MFLISSNFMPDIIYLIARKASPNRAGIQAHTAKRYLQ